MIKTATFNRPGHRPIMERLHRFIAWGLLCVGIGLLLPETADGFERRREQFIDTPGYLILPLPYSYPGIGDGFVLVGYAGNIFGSQTDAILLGFSGDADGYYCWSTKSFWSTGFYTSTPGK
jgi:hypothetical protein